MKSPAGEQHCDVIYHRYPSKDFDDAPKPIPTAIAVDDEDTDEEDEASRRQVPMTPPSTSEQELQCTKQSVCARLGRLLVFHTLNAVLGIGGAILVLVLVPLSVGLVPLFGAGLVLFQVSAAVVDVLARTDVRLANLVQPQPKLRKAFGVQSGFSTNNGCSNCGARLLFLSPKTLLVMLYFATVKLLVGIMSTIAVGWGLVLPIESLCSGGHADAIGWVNYQDHPGAYVGVVMGGWALGVLCFVLVPKPSVALTKWACAEHEAEDQVYSKNVACGSKEPTADLEAAVVVEAPEAKDVV